MDFLLNFFGVKCNHTYHNAVGQKSKLRSGKAKKRKEGVCNCSVITKTGMNVIIKCTAYN